MEDQSAAGLVAVECHPCVLERQGVAGPVDLPFDGRGVATLGAGQGYAEPARSAAHAGCRQLGLAGELQAFADIQMTLEARFQQVALESELRWPTRWIALLGAGSEGCI